jgi:hypothetical protein
MAMRAKARQKKKSAARRPAARVDGQRVMHFGSLTEPFGNQRSMATHKEDAPPKEMARRAQAAMANMPGAAS